MYGMHNKAAQGDGLKITNFLSGVLYRNISIKKTLFVLVLIGYIPSIQIASAFEPGECKKLFEQTNSLSEKAGQEKDENAQENYLRQIVTSIISAMEAYLNNCTDPKIIMSNQSAVIDSLVKIAKQDCPSSESTPQFIDVNKDGSKEFILHTKLLACEDFSGPYGAGFSSIYFLDKESERWKGYPIWPKELIEKSTSDMKITDFIYPQYLPKIYMLDFKDSRGRTFMAIESEFEGGDNLTNRLSIIQWDGQKHKEILNLDLSDWCGQPHYWTITKRGTIEVPAAEATDQCERREKKEYSLEQP
jgi:hypothetical protein